MHDTPTVSVCMPATLILVASTVFELKITGGLRGLTSKIIFRQAQQLGYITGSDSPTMGSTVR